MFCSQFGTNLPPIPWIMMIAVENCLVLSLPAESYVNAGAMAMIYWSAPY